MKKPKQNKTKVFGQFKLCKTIFKQIRKQK